ncbi:CAP domain-containing protein [Caballeronia sp. LjRoot34]|uniref:CAP domain-containing protein n=1 Tax=Caballeronia sp. LjRoot34 TaxID=3342325 RepID=UPI003ECDC149
MLTKQTYKLTALAIAGSLVLAACGGGGGGGSNSAAPASSASSPPATTSGAVAVQTSVPAPTYGTGTMQASAFSTLNAYRLSMGVGEVAQDPILDTSAMAHALYLDSNLANGNLTALSHDEVSTFANYYSATPLSRAQLAGAPATEWIGEDIAAGYPQTSAAAYGSNCVNIYLDTVYHLQSVTSNQQTIGIGFQQNSGSYPNYSCVLDFGETAGVSGAPQANSFNASGGQQMPTTTIAHSPLVNEPNVALAMMKEDVNVAPDIAAPGRPIMVLVNAANAGDVLTVSSFTLTAANGAVVAARIIVPSAALTGSSAGVTADVNNALFQGVAFLLPLAPLTANTTYTATFSGARDGTPISATWSFTTAAS